MSNSNQVQFNVNEESGGGKNNKVIMGYDLISPYSFIAYQLHQYRYQTKPKPTTSSTSSDDDVNITWDYLPVPIRDLFKLSNNVPPLESNKNKIQYLRHDIKNVAEYAKIPMKMHSRFPIDTRKAMRILSYLRLNYPIDKYNDCLKVLWEGFYYHQSDIDHIEVIHHLLSPLFPTDEDELTSILSKSNDDEDQDQELTKNTQFLNKKGAYGLPYFIAESSHPTIEGVGTELTQFGADRIPLIYQFFKLSHPTILLNPTTTDSDKISPFHGSVTMAFDLLSPYCYFARKILKRYEKEWKIEIDYEPVHMATVFEESGNVGPIFGCENKRQYTFQDLKILPKFYDVEFRLPTKFPTDTKLIMTILTLIKSELSSVEFREVVDTIWDGFFVNDLDIANPDIILNLLTPLLPHPTDPHTILEAAKEKFSLVMTKSKELVNHHGAHGLPYFIVVTHTTTSAHTNTNQTTTTTDNDIKYYFGSDKLPLLAHHLNRNYDGPQP